MYHATLSAFVSLAFIFFAAWIAGSNRNATIAAHPEWSLGGIAARLGLHLVDGDPAFNVVYNERSTALARALAARVRVDEFGFRLLGAVCDRPIEIVHRDRIEVDRTLFDARTTRTVRGRIAVGVCGTFAPFEIGLRFPHSHAQPTRRMQHLPLSSFGNTMLDSRLVIHCADPRVGPAIATALTPIAAFGFVHITGEDDVAAFELNHPFALELFSQADIVGSVLAAVASGLEAAMCATTDESGDSHDDAHSGVTGFEPTLLDARVA